MDDMVNEGFRDLCLISEKERVWDLSQLLFVDLALVIDSVRKLKREGGS